MHSGPITILVGMDFSESAERALSYAVDLCERLGGRIDLVHVTPATASALPELVLAAPSDMGELNRLRQDLERIRERIPGIATQTHLRIGDAVSGILEVIEQERPSLVIVGSHGRGAVMRTLLGSVSERLCRRSPVPVLVIPTAARIDATREHRLEEAAGGEVAWSCAGCGHIRKGVEGRERCARCGQEPALWNSAPVTHRPVDTQEPAVGESVETARTEEFSTDVNELFQTSPPGTSGYDVNPELRIRY